MKLLTKIISPNGQNHSATVIFFHGSGDTGHNLVDWIRYLLGRDFESSHIRFIFPTAPLQPYTPLNGELSNVWFDRRSISIEVKENRKSLAAIYLSVNELIRSEIDQGISPTRIIIGGFSMGGALALHTGYHLNTAIAGVFACSSFLNRESVIYDSLNNQTNPNSELPELLMFHGERDNLVPIAWGEETFSNLKSLGINGNFVRLTNTFHELKKRELLILNNWIQKKLPGNITTDNMQNKL